MLVVDLISFSYMDEMTERKKIIKKRQTHKYCWVLEIVHKYQKAETAISQHLRCDALWNWDGGKQKHKFKHVVSRAGEEGDSYVASSGKNIPGQI